MDGRKLYSIVIHSATHSPEDILLNKIIFEGLFSESDYIRICDAQDYDSLSKRQSNSLILQIKSNTMQNINSGRLEISLSKSAAEPLRIKPLTNNTRRFVVEKVTADQVKIDFVEVGFAKKFLTRGNMWRFKNGMLERAIYLGQQIDHGRIKLPVQEIGLKGVPKISGIIVKDTTFIFRSR